MPVFALWSAPRARSTAFFRSMLERGDLIALHEPFCNLTCFGETDAGGRTFDSAVSLLAWLRDETNDVSVLLKDTTDYRHREVLADRRFLADARHAFLIRRPEEIAASYHALYPDMSINAIGLEALHELHTAGTLACSGRGCWPGRSSPAGWGPAGGGAADWFSGYARRDET